MTEIIKTESIGKNFVKTDGVLLQETADTALVFFPDIHPGGVRGHLVRFKKNRNEIWERILEKDFRTLKLYEGVRIELGTKELKKLVEETNKRNEISYQGIKYGENKYIVSEVNDENIGEINDQNIKHAVSQILKKGYSEDFWNLLNSSDPNLADQISAGHLQLQRKKIVDELKDRLNQRFHETKGDDSWQQWIYKNNWLFGTCYQNPIEKQKINIKGIMPDFLFPTVDNFVDILEIKLPSFEVIEQDKNHKGSWVWSKESNYAIGQVITYLNEIDRLKLEIENTIRNDHHKDCSMLKPRAYILIGQNADWSKDKKEGLRRLNNSLHWIEVITYSDLVKRGETFIRLSMEDYAE